MKEFGSVLNCMDGRVQRKVSDYLTATFGVRFVDTITSPGMVQHVAAQTPRTEGVLADLRISLEKHGSAHIGVAAHSDCAGNPVADKTQKDQVGAAMARLAEVFPETQVVGLWVNDRWIVERIR
jgi:carbonic anhydrase